MSQSKVVVYLQLFMSFLV